MGTMLTSPSSAARGMSKREFFAARAITGMALEAPRPDPNHSPPTYYDVWMKDRTKRAVDIADALIEALNAADTRDQ